MNEKIGVLVGGIWLRTGPGDAPETIFEEEREIALKVGRCMACDAKLVQTSHRRRVICNNTDCKRYYHALYQQQPGRQTPRRPATKKTETLKRGKRRIPVEVTKDEYGGTGPAWLGPRPSPVQT